MKRKSLFETPVALALLVIPTVACGFLNSSLQDWLDFPEHFSILFASLSVLPSLVAVAYPLHLLDKRRLQEDIEFGLTDHGFLWGQAFALLSAPFVANGDAQTRWTCWSAAILSSILAAALQLRRSHRLALAKLAEKSPTLAIRFTYQHDRRAWPEISPTNALAYQRAFERILDELAAANITTWEDLTEIHAKRMIEIAESFRYTHSSLYPGTIVSLVLLFLDETPGRRESLRSEWVGYQATRENAQMIRKTVESRMRSLFKRYSDNFDA